jgi:fibronectin-binding autotransporter adhesin
MSITVTSGRSRLLWLAVAIANLPATASAATFWWDTTTAGLWTDGANWSDDATSGGTTGTVPANSTTTDNVVFNQSSVNGDTIVQLNADRLIGGVVVANTGSTSFTSDSSTSRLLTLGASGLTVNAGAGVVSLGDATNPLNIAVAVNQNFTNNSSSVLGILGDISRASGDTSSRTLSVLGTGRTVLSGVISNGGGSGTLVFRTGTQSASPTGFTGIVELSGANTFSGGATLNSGTVRLGASTVMAGGTITSGPLGTGAVGIPANNSVFMTLSGNDASTNRTINNNINIGSSAGTGGVLIGDGVNNASVELSGTITNFFQNRTFTNNLSGNGVFTLSGRVFSDSVSSGRLLTFTGPGNTVLSGTFVPGVNATTGGSFAYSGSGTTTLSGSFGYTGSTTVSGTGTVILGSSSALGQSGSSAVLISANATLQSGNDSLAFSNNVRVAGGGGGAVNMTISGSNSLGLTGTLTNATQSNTLTNKIESGKLLTLGAIGLSESTGGRTLTLAGSGNTTIGGVIFNGTAATVASAFTISNTGTTTLAAANTYTGVTTLNGGIVNLNVAENAGTAGPLGSSAASNPGSIVLNGGTLQYSAANQSDYSGRFSTAISQRYNVDTNGQAVTWGANLTSQFGTLTKSGSGTLVLSGVNTYTGTTTLSAGIINLGSAETAGTSGPLGRSAATNAGSIVLAGGTLQYSASNNNDYSGRFSTAADQRYNVDTNGRDVTWATALTSSGGSLTKLGSGTLALQGNNTYSGQTTISAGVLALGVNGSFVNSTSIKVGDAGSTNAVLDLTAKTASFTIGAGQTLSGGGTVLVAPSQQFLVQGTFAPGNSPGLFTFDGGTTVLSGTTVMEIFGTSRATSPSHGTGFYDAVNIVDNGTLQFGGNLTFEFSSLFDNNSTFDLFTPASGSFLSGNFSSVTVAGSFYTGLSWEQSGTVWRSSNTVAGQSLEFNAANGQLVIVPEPAALALAGIGLGLTAWAARRRQRRAS